MLHILLLVLKIIGIILAVILGILVLLVCIVVFVPVRYEVNGKCSGKFQTLKVKGKVTWLFSLVRADIYYKENKLKWRLRIAWKKILGGQEYGADMSSVGMPPEDAGEQNKRTEGEEYEETWKKTDDDEESGKEAWRNESQTSEESHEEIWWDEFGEGEKDEEDEKIYQEILESLAEEYPEDEEEDYEERQDYEGWDGKKNGRGQSFLEKLKGIYRKIKCTIRNICDKIKELLEKKNRLLGFLKDAGHVGAYRKAKKEAFRLLRRLKPKKLLIQAEFGFNDPSLTGRMLAALAPFYPYFSECISLKPDFTGRGLNGRLYMKGHIRCFHFIALVWNLFWDKNVRRTYKDIKNFEL